jgi:hypothetical protein
MFAFAKEIPGLMSDFFRITQQHRSGPRKPWQFDPCSFHIHLNKVQTISCPRGCGGKSSYDWEFGSAQVLYIMQSEYLKRKKTFSIAEMSMRKSLKFSKDEIVQSVKFLIMDNVGGERLDYRHVFALVVPEDGGEEHGVGEIGKGEVDDDEADEGEGKDEGGDN